MNANEITKNLWVGGLPRPEDVAKSFDALVLCAREFQDVFPVQQHPDVELILAPMDDGQPTVVEKALAIKTALKVHSLIQRGKKVLVTCSAGVNRSAMVAALTLLLLGLPASKAISLIRKKRKPLHSFMVPLANQHFVKFIKEVHESLEEVSTPTAESTHKG